METPDPETNSMEEKVDFEDDVANMAASIFDQVRKIKQEHPDVGRKVDSLELEIRDRIEEIKDTISELNNREQELVTVFVMNGINRTAEEILLEGEQDWA